MLTPYSTQICSDDQNLTKIVHHRETGFGIDFGLSPTSFDLIFQYSGFNSPYALTEYVNLEYKNNLVIDVR